MPKKRSTFLRAFCLFNHSSHSSGRDGYYANRNQRQEIREEPERPPAMPPVVLELHRDLNYLRERALQRLNGQDEYGNTALHRAVLRNDLPEMRRLVDLGIDLGIRNNNGRTALQLAVDINPDQQAAHAALNARDPRGLSALDRAVLEEDEERVLELLELGARF